ncbi:hypothetical protein, partial [Chlorogloea sp. CCALA 695]|uniref:hypothetical protein n=1 Tax=Chlorogloea sp. CCALA 695 TaxID=2107693 RepID=UPI000D43700C
MPELTDFATSSIQTLLAEDLWIAVEAISTLTNRYELNDLQQFEIKPTTNIVNFEDVKKKIIKK